MNIYFISFEVTPTTGSLNETEFGGAIINAWIKAESQSLAEKQYKKTVTETEWIPVSLEQIFKITENHYDEDEEGLEYFEQAKVDGEVYVIHTWPNEPQEHENYH